MCHFISLAVDERQVDHVESVRKEYGFRTWPCGNQSVLRALPGGVRAFDVTVGQCSCDLIPRASDHDPNRLARAAEARYRKRGWSTSKVKRALEAKVAAARRPLPQPQVARFPDFVAELVARCDFVYLLVHFYHGETASEQFKVGPTHTVSVADLLRETWQYPEDAVLQVVRGGRLTRG